MNKADRLYVITDPNEPVFPLDSDILEDLADYPGEVPTDLNHWVDLMTKVPPADPDPPAN